MLDTPKNMIVIRDSSPLPQALAGCVVALGNFDGLHLGHKAVIGKAVDIARSPSKSLAVMTFEPHPRQLFRPDLPSLRILPLAEKMRLLGSIGVDFLRIVRFTRAFSHTSAEDFVSGYLHRDLKLSHAVIGDDFTFGHNRGGDVATLTKMAQKLGFEVTICSQLNVDGQRCSSTRLRDVLAAGDMQQVATLLGRPYKMTGIVQQGNKRGRTIGFPTANLYPRATFLPAYGVYAVRATIKSQQVKGVANLGMRPTFSGIRVRLEMHLFDFNQDIYGERMDVELLHFIRPEQKFDGLEALKAQIAKDCEWARFLKP